MPIKTKLVRVHNFLNAVSGITMWFAKQIVGASS